MNRIRAVTLDATGTLFSSPNLAEIYSQVMCRHGIEVTPHEIRRLFPVVWRELDCRIELGRDRFASHPEGARGWWRRFLERLCEHLETGPPSPFAAAELFDRFAHADAWEVFPEVPQTLEALKSHRIALAVVSNWDERLPLLLQRLKLTEFFDAVQVSSTFGVAKPNPRIFLHTVQLLGVEPQQGLHVGDNQREDVEGALAAGMHTLRLDRRQPRTEADVLADLSSLPDRVAEWN